MAAITSTASGNWGTGGTWVGGIAPVEGDTVTIASGHTVTVDGTYIVGSDPGSAGLAAVTVAAGGTLKASRIANSSLTLKGDLVTASYVSASDVWNTLMSNISVSGSIGNKLKGSLTLGEFIALK
jgi:hypothetical protein